MKTCRRCCWRPRSATLPSTFMSTKHPKVNFYFSDFLARSLCCTHTRGEDYAGLMKPSDGANGMHPPAHATSQTPHANLSAGINNLILTLSHQISILSSSATPLFCCAECENFLKLCKVKYYNFSPFHRVVKDFIAQTGDPLGSGKGGKSIWGYANTPVCLCVCVCVRVRVRAYDFLRSVMCCLGRRAFDLRTNGCVFDHGRESHFLRSRLFLTPPPLPRPQVGAR